MAKTYAELSRDIEALQVQAEATRQKEKAGVVERIRAAVAVYGLTAEELGLGQKSPKTTALNGGDPTAARNDRAADKQPPPKLGAAKYADATGNTWGGRGPKPNWLKDGLARGRSLESFATSASVSAKSPASVGSAAGSRVKPESGKGPKATKGTKAFKSVVKYRDNDGHAWSGRGPKPAWFTSAIERGITPQQLLAV